MPTYVRTDKCDGCKGQDKTACMYICPQRLLPYTGVNRMFELDPERDT